MSKPNAVCQTCLAEIPAWALAGNCPSCMMGGPVKSHDKSEPEREAIAGWEIGERIGEGAFGVVFKASQSQPVKRTAAMKILRPAMSSRETLARFEVERQALAMINHEGVVTIFDAGTTDDGRPFYVMEFVDGMPVTKFAAALSLDEKLALFDQVCAVVAHAHLCGVIHRDLKPANILVAENGSSGPQVKLLDFGIAKATETVLTEKTLMTTEGQLLGTPEYMSPEQAVGGDVDTRADVYSLGVIFFELLAGRPPFVLAGNSLDAVVSFLDSVRKGSAPRPSEFASQTIPTDLNWIAAKAIEPDVERRYQSVRELREDLQRFAENQPVNARAPDQAYLLKKFLRRHWKAVTVAAVLVGTIATAAVTSTMMAIRAREASLETSAAYSRSDLEAAVRSLDENRITESMTSLRRALENQPSNHEAKRLLHSIGKHYPVAQLVSERILYDRGVSQSWPLDDQGGVAFVTEDGNLKWSDSSTVLRVRGTNHRVLADSEQKLLAVGNLEGGLSLVDLKTRSFRAENLFPENRQRYTAFQFSHNGELFFATTWGQEVRAWDTTSGELLWAARPGFRPLALLCSSDHKTLLIGTQNGTLEKRDMKTGKMIGAPVRLSGRILELIMHEGNEIFAIHDPGFVSRVNIKTSSHDRIPLTWNGDYETHAVQANRRATVSYAMGTESEGCCCGQGTVKKRFVFL